MRKTLHHADKYDIESERRHGHAGVKERVSGKDSAKISEPINRLSSKGCPRDIVYAYGGVTPACKWIAKVVSSGSQKWSNAEFLLPNNCKKSEER